MTAAAENRYPTSTGSTWRQVAPDLMCELQQQETAPSSDSGSTRSNAAQFRFPENFLFGAATSSHQVEGNCTNNDWWAWEQSGRVRDASAAACDHYRRFREDFDIARELGHDAHRFSLEWSRIEPEEGRFSADALDHYREVIDALKDRGMEPVVTLHHFTLPLWLARRGGWENPEMEAWFARYVGVVLDAFHDRVRWWITINEPLAYVHKGYVVGEWPPGKQEVGAAARVIRNMLRAHVAAYRIIHACRADAMVSVAQHALAVTACDHRRLRDRFTGWVRAYLCNHLFIGALHRGSVRIPGLMWVRLPARRTLDFIGFNYYTRDFAHNAGFNLAGFLAGSCSKSHRLRIGKRNRLGWEVYPEGMGQLLHEYNRYGLPILITENGVAARSDADRWNYIYLHLWQTARAIGQGVPVVGYLYWSLLDNFEWAEGYRARFGLVEVDFETQERRVRPSARLLGSIMRRRQL